MGKQYATDTSEERTLVFLFGLLLLLLLLLETSMTSPTKKSRRPTSQLNVAVAACMTLARHPEEV